MKRFKVRASKSKMQKSLLAVSIVMLILNIVIVACYGFSFGAVVNCALFTVIFLLNYFVRE